MTENQQKRLISVIIPTLNESGNVQAMYDRIVAVFDSELSHYDFEMVVTDNCSADDTFEQLSRIAAQDDRVRAYRFARNFGFQKSIFAGYLLAKGDAVIQLDADLQDPPELVPKLVELWEGGAKVAYGVRKKRHGEQRSLTAARRIFYRMIDWLSEEEELPHDAGDFRLVDRVVVDLLHHSHDASPYLRGTIASLGFEQVGLEYERDDRTSGETKFRLSSLVRLAVDGILNHSTRPLQLASFTAIVVVVVAVLAIAAYVVSSLLFGQEWPAGFVTLALLQLVGILLNAAFLGIIGAYLGRMFKQTRQQPFVVIGDATTTAPPLLITPAPTIRIVNSGGVLDE